MSRKICKTTIDNLILVNLIKEYLEEDYQIALFFIFKEEKNYSVLINKRKLDIINILARLTNLTILKEAINKGFSYYSKEELYENAAFGNNLDILNYYYTTPKEFFQSTCYAFALTGNLESLKWINGKYDIVHTNQKHTYTFSSAIAMAAVEGEHLHVVKWLKKNNCHFDNLVLLFAAKKANYEIFTFLHSKKKIINQFVMQNALIGGNIKIIEYLLSKNYVLENNCINYASESCSIQLLKYLFDKGYNLHYSVYMYAAKKNKIDIMNWAFENNCPIDNCIFYAAAQNGNVDVLEWCHQKNFPRPELTSTWVNTAAKNGHQNVIEWIISKEYFFNKSLICYNATYSKKIDFIKWLHLNGFPYSYGMLEIAWNTNYEFFKQLCTIGCPFDYKICYELAAKGAYSMIISIIEAGIPPCDEICTHAALGGHLNILKLLNQYGAKCNIGVSLNAAKRGDLKMLIWAIEHGSPINDSTFNAAYFNNHRHIIKYLIDNKYKCDKKYIEIYRNYYQLH